MGNISLEMFILSRVKVLEKLLVLALKFDLLNLCLYLQYPLNVVHLNT